MTKSMPWYANLSIKSQVILYLVTGVSLMIILLGLITTSGVNQHSRQLMIDNAYQIANSLAERSVFPLLSGTSQNAQEAMQQAVRFKSVQAARILTDKNTTFLVMGQFPQTLPSYQYSTFDSEGQILETSNYWLLRAPIQIKPEPQSQENSEFALDSELSEKQTIGYVELIYGKSYLEQVNQKVAIIVASVGVISIVLLAIILRVSLSSLFRPLGKLVKTMQSAERTGDHIFAAVEGGKEIRLIAQAYNNMMTVLDEQDEVLKQHRDKLEAQVEKRTQELVIARDDAIAASKHKSEFIANISHELRTPIQSIIGYGELVTEELELEGQFELIDDMDKILKNSARLLSLINGLLDLAKIEAGRMDVANEEIVVEDLLKSVADVIHPLASAKGNQFKFDNQLGLSSFMADKEKLEQVLLNLLSNACKFTQNGEVTLALMQSENQLQMQVIDTGIGLDEQHQDMIFDEFRQVDGSHKRKFSGTGLGLAISKRFIELMKGNISVTSELGHGARFTITLPLNSSR